MVVPPIRQRTPEVYREAIVLSLEISILLGGALLLYAILLILEQIFSYSGVMLLSIGGIFLLYFDHSNNHGSLAITTVRKFSEIGEQLGLAIVRIVDKLCDRKPTIQQDSEARNSRTVATGISYVAYVGVLVQLFLKYPISRDTFFTGGLIVIAMGANHILLLSREWDLMKETGIGENHEDDQTGSKNKVVGEELKEVKAKYEEDRQKWKDEKRDLIEQLHKAKAEMSQLRKEAKPYSMFGNFDWD